MFYKVLINNINVRDSILPIALVSITFTEGGNNIFFIEMPGNDCFFNIRCHINKFVKILIIFFTSESSANETYHCLLPKL